jgi:hypothetical protein
MTAEARSADDDRRDGVLPHLQAPRNQDDEKLPGRTRPERSIRQGVRGHCPGGALPSRRSRPGDRKRLTPHGAGGMPGRGLAVHTRPRESSEELPGVGFEASSPASSSSSSKAGPHATTSASRSHSMLPSAASFGKPVWERRSSRRAIFASPGGDHDGSESARTSSHVSGPSGSRSTRRHGKRRRESLFLPETVSRNLLPFTALTDRSPTRSPLRWPRRSRFDRSDRR